MNTLNQNRMFDTKSAVIAGSLVTAVNEIMPAIESKIRAAAKSEDARIESIAVSKYPTNSIDGTFEVAVSCLRADGAYDFSVPVVLKAGKPALTEAAVVDAMNAALVAHKAAPVKLSHVSSASMPVDLAKLTAERHGDLVVYAHPDLPNWAYMASTATLSDTKNRAIIASCVVSAIRGFCLSDFNAIAAFGTQSFALPMVCEINVVAAAVPAEAIPGFWSPKTETQIEAEVFERNLVVHGAMASQAPMSLNTEEDRKYRIHSEMRRLVTPAIEKYVKGVLQGSSTQVLDMDFSRARAKTTGVWAGEIQAQVRFYSATSVEDTTLVIAFDEKGRIDAGNIKKSALAIKAEQQREKDLQILSEEQAAKNFAEYTRSLEAANTLAIEAGLGVDASAAGALGTNLFNVPAPTHVPYLKALLPTGTEVGDKLEVRGYVYQVCPTDFNSVDVEHSAHVMLVLTSDLPGKAPSIGVWG